LPSRAPKNNYFSSGASGEAYFVPLVEESQQIIRQVCAEFFAGKKAEIPDLAQKLCQRKITPEEAVNLLCGPAAVKEAARRVNERLQRQLHLFLPAGKKPFAWSGQPSSGEQQLIAVLRDQRWQKALALAGGWCYETILGTFFRAVPGKGHAAANLWSFLCAPFSVDHAAELEKRLTSLLTWTQNGLSHAFEQELAQTVYRAWDASAERLLTDLAG